MPHTASISRPLRCSSLRCTAISRERAKGDWFAREVLLRKTPLTRGGWLFFLVLCVVLAISATYELVEWTAALATGSRADAFLGTQGDPWDTQKDMALAAVGGLAAQLLLSRAHDRQLSRLS